MTYFATMMAASDDAAERARAIAAAKVQVGRSGRHVAQQAIQPTSSLSAFWLSVLGEVMADITANPDG